MDGNNGTFSEWRRLILHQLEQLEVGLKESNTDSENAFKDLERQFNELNVKLEKLISEVTVRAAVISGGVTLALGTVAVVISLFV